MRAFVLRLNPDTRSSTPCSKYPTRAEYDAIHAAAPMDGFHEAVNFLPERGVVRGYLPPKHSSGLRSSEQFALVTITAKTARIDGDCIVGFQVGCLYQGQSDRKNVPRESRNLGLVWHFACPASLSFLLPNPIPNARELVVGSASNWLRIPTHKIEPAKFASLLTLARKKLAHASDQDALDKLAKAAKSKLGSVTLGTFDEINSDFETEVVNALGDPLDNVTGNAHPEQILVSSFQYVRDPKVVAYALKKANGFCDDCHQPAPFVSARTGQPFLEVHHIRTLKDGGSDTIDNVIALCPNCHRKRHYGSIRSDA